MKKFVNVPYPVYATLIAVKVILVVALLAGCSTPPSVRVDKAPGAALSQYRTFAFYDRNPDLKVNFSVRITERQELRSYPTNAGVFVRRVGVQDVDVVNFRQGTVSIDLVDNHLKSLVWQGVADGRVDDRMIEEPGKAIDTVVKGEGAGWGKWGVSLESLTMSWASD